ncbi:MAG: orotidine-5'-phosphate decarboxylase [Chloroflexi bacterium]|nr:MAG: orotidine-5'-phosphate decarboxylase [Chloroflexota bacterium]
MKKSASFIEKLTNAITGHDSLLCVGLDPDPYTYPDRFSNLSQDPAAALLRWGQAIIEQTADLVCCYKPNIAFYEQFGPEGLAALRQTIAAVPPDIPVLLDAKRGDIGSTATAYARGVFDTLQADAVTLSPYLGADSIRPFLAYPGKTVFVLCHTSNPSAGQLQEFGDPSGPRLFEHTARQAQTWGDPSQVGLVVGATYPDRLAHIRRLAPDRWILAPGVGAQGGSLSAALQAGLSTDGRGLIIPASRSIIYSPDPRAAADDLRRQINLARQNITPPADEPAYADFIQQLHQVGCVRFGRFTLASGRQSSLYIDLRRIMSRPDLLRAAAHIYADLLRPLTYDRLAATPYAALTLGAAAALAVNKPLIYPRKEIKDHGTAQPIEGNFAPGETVVVIEDLVTSGGSVLQAADRLQAAGLRVSHVVALVDREQGARQALHRHGIELRTAFTLRQILDVLRQQGVEVEGGEGMKDEG